MPDWLSFDWLSADWLYYGLAALLVLVNVALWFLNLLALPGNWLMVASTALFVWLVPHEVESGLSWWLVGMLVLVAALGELIEFAASAAGAAKQGASRRAMVLAVVGTMVGSLLGATAGIPVPLIGPVVGAVGGGALGAFAGAWTGEAWKGKTARQSLDVSKAALVGKLLGTLAKLWCGALMIMLVLTDLVF